MRILQQAYQSLGFQSSVFKMFSLRWFLSVYPKSVHNMDTWSVQLTLAAFPENVTVLYTRCIFTIIQLNKRYILNGIFSAGNLIIGWGKDLLCVEELDGYTIRLDMELIDVYDSDMNVTNQFVNDMKYNYDYKEVSGLEEKEFETWLCDTVRLPVYHSLFVGNGIDKLSIVKLVTIKELNEMGITIIGHRLKILHEIKALNTISV